MSPVTYDSRPYCDTAEEKERVSKIGVINMLEVLREELK